MWKPSHRQRQSRGGGEITHTRSRPRSSLFSSGSQSSIPAHASSSTPTSRIVVWGRVIFVFSLVSAAVVLGYLGYRYTRQAETSMANDQFASLATRVLHYSVQTFGQKRLALLSMSTYIGQWNPRASDWPFVVQPGFEEMSRHLLDTISGDDLGFLPIVNASVLSDWEQFAYDYYYNKRNPPFAPNTVGNVSFGFGVWSTDPTTGEQYHDNQPTTTWNSSRPTMKTPVLHVDDHTNLIVMYNLYSNEVRGSPIDEIMDCVEQKLQPDIRNCSSISNIIPNMLKWKGAIGPGAVLYQPVFPRDNRSTITGFTVSSIRFEKILENAFADAVNGVDCVLSSKDEGPVFTYGVKDGLLFEKGYGDVHEKDKTGYCRALNEDESYYSNPYSLCLYATDAYYESLSTSNPRTATIGAVLVIFVTSLIFLFYDFAVKREFHNKRELLEAKRRFMRFVSHEVRTPLNAVCMGLAVLQVELAAALGKPSVEDLERNLEDYQPSTPQEESYLSWFRLSSDVREGAMNAAEILSDLLNFDRIQHGQLQLELSVLSFADLVEKSVREFQLPASKKNLSLTMELDHAGRQSDVEQPSKSSNSLSLDSSTRNMKLVGDAARLTQCFRNLISNAIKFTEERGSIRVVVSWITSEGTPEAIPFILKDGKDVAYPQCGTLRISVIDTGAGLSTDQLSRLFKDGIQFNVNDLQAGQGSGLGLYITMGIVQQHNGTIRAKSEGLLKGSTFTITLPLYLVPETGELESEEIDQEAKSRCNEHMHVLVVDDVMSNRKLLGRLLKNRGHTYDEAANGQVAVEMVNTNRRKRSARRYDTILMDYEMPVLNGPAAATKLREQGFNVFIVGITGNLLPEDVHHFRCAGADAVLPKPFTMKDLEELWEEHDIRGRSKECASFNKILQSA